jgi:hypothetical protein
VRDILDRFRPAGTPGAATAAGVPADRRESAAAELEPVFAALAETVARCAAVRREAAAKAEHDRHEAAERAHAILARAHAGAEAERASAAAALRQDAELSASEGLRRAMARAEEIRRAGGARLPDLVERALDRVRADIRAFAPEPGSRP